MKKVLLFILCLSLVVGCSTQGEKTNSKNTNSNSNSSSNVSSNDGKVEEKNKAQLYLFYSDSCTFCHQEKTWLESIDGEYSYLDIHFYEVSRNSDLYNKVKEVYGIETTSVPLTIIGDEYFVGFTDSKGRKFLRTAEQTYERGVCDVVGTIIVGGDIQACVEKNKGE